MNVNTLDLNLLRVFDAVMREGSITSAGARLGLTQPTISNALKRLRDQFGDALFVRTTSGMQPTPYARQLAGSIADAMGTIRGALELDRTFDPSLSSRTFTILMTDIAELMFLPLLLAHLESAAPNVNLVSSLIPRERYRDALESSMADLAIGQLPEGHSDFHQQALCEEPFVCVMRKDHSTIGDAVSLHQFLDARHIAIIHSAAGDSWIRKALGNCAEKRRIALRLPHYMAVPMILAKSDLIAVLPHVVASAFSGLIELKALALPFKMPRAQIRQFWHERSHQDPGHRWLRRLVVQLFKSA